MYCLFAERATSDKNTTDDWSVILDVCDRVKEYSDGPKDCVKSLTKKLANDNPRVAIQAITVSSVIAILIAISFIQEKASHFSMFIHSLMGCLVARVFFLPDASSWSSQFNTMKL